MAARRALDTAATPPRRGMLTRGTDREPGAGVAGGNEGEAEGGLVVGMATSERTREARPPGCCRS